MIVVEIDVLVLKRPPEAFDVNVVQGPVYAVHADLDAVLFEDRDERIRGELAPLIRVEDRRYAPDRNSFLESRDAGLRVERV